MTLFCSGFPVEYLIHFEEVFRGREVPVECLGEFSDVTPSVRTGCEAAPENFLL